MTTKIGKSNLQANFALDAIKHVEYNLQKAREIVQKLNEECNGLYFLRVSLENGQVSLNYSGSYPVIQYLSEVVVRYYPIIMHYDIPDRELSNSLWEEMSQLVGVYESDEVMIWAVNITYRELGV
jgi:hypothetical protein